MCHLDMLNWGKERVHAQGELLKKPCFIVYAQGNDQAFQEVAGESYGTRNPRTIGFWRMRCAANLEQCYRQHNLLNGDSGPDRAQHAKLTVIPFEREKQLPLVETILPERRASDLILDRANQHLFLSLLDEFRQRDTLGAHGLRPRSRLLFWWTAGCGQDLCAEVCPH